MMQQVYMHESVVGLIWLEFYILIQLVAAATGGVTALAGPTCDAPLIASQLTKLCSVELDAPGALCCTVVLMTVEQDTDCLCWVADEPEFDLSDLSVAKVWGWYKSCGGRRRSVPRKSEHEPLRAWVFAAAAAAASQARGTFGLAIEAVACSVVAVRCSRRCHHLWCPQTMASADCTRYSLSLLIAVGTTNNWWWQL
jgi:hypothetical protein